MYELRDGNLRSVEQYIESLLLKIADIDNNEEVRQILKKDVLSIANTAYIMGRTNKNYDTTMSAYEGETPQERIARIRSYNY